ncbi:MAG: hypothetical protein ABIL25_10365 [candidate division WOR-3 bacterium]
MILGKAEILKEIAAGWLKIDPFDETAIGMASIELRLKPEFGFFRESGKMVDPACVLADSDVVWRRTASQEGPIVAPWPQPNCRVVGKTVERITLSDGLCGWVTPKARTAIFGFSLSITTGFIQPGTQNEELFFLITNTGQLPLHLRPGIRICQLVLSRVGSE